MQYRFIIVGIVWLILTGCQPPSPTDTTSTAAETPEPPTPTAGGGIVRKTATPISTISPTVAATVSPASVVHDEPTTSSSPMIAVTTAHPVRLQIPVIEVDAAIEAVGQDSEGNMEVPQQVENVGWYSLGERPGEVGSAVMAGHLDNYLQQPAVFWRLEELQVGDTITVVDETGVEHIFTVTGTEIYQYDQAPIAKIFGSDGTPTLQLITCRGIWDSVEQNYNERLVVYSRLVN